MTLFDPVAPDWLDRPHQEERKFNEKSIVGWSGRARIEQLTSWDNNPRIEIPVEQWKQDNLGRDPNNEDLLDIMLDYSVDSQESNASAQTGEEEENSDIDARRSRRNALLELAESIRRNGIRVPLIVTHDKRILDGNRRFLANLYIHRTIEDPEQRLAFTTVPVWVLPSNADEPTQDRVLTELNAITECTVKWPYYILAKRIFEDANAKPGLSIDELARKYHNYSKGRIKTTIEAYGVASEFIEYHDFSLEAKDKAYRKLIWFDELRRSNRKAMENQDFREAIYDLVLDAYSPFSNHNDFRRLGEIYDNSEAWKALLATDSGQSSLKRALFILDREKYEGKTDIPSRMKRVNDLLTGTVDNPALTLVDPNVLRTFHDLAEKVPNPADPSTRVRRLMDLLNNLTSKEIAGLPKNIIQELGAVAERVKKQAQSSRGS